MYQSSFKTKNVSIHYVQNILGRTSFGVLEVIKSERNGRSNLIFLKNLEIQVLIQEEQEKQ